MLTSSPWRRLCTPNVVRRLVLLHGRTSPYSSLSVTVSFSGLSALSSLLVKTRITREPQQFDFSAGLTNLVRWNQTPRLHHVTSLPDWLRETRKQCSPQLVAGRHHRGHHQRQDTLLGVFCSAQNGPEIAIIAKTRSSVSSAPPCAGRSSPRVTSCLLAGNSRLADV